MQVKTVNLAEIASVFGGRAKPDSRYKRLQRFFRFFELSYAEIARFGVKLLGLQGPWVLSLDRTEWQLGQRKINILLLGIVYKGVAFPLVWLLLPKQGNSNTDEHIAVLETFLALFGPAQIQSLCADREFVGKRWFRYLHDRQIDFRIRVRENTLIPNSRGKLVAAKNLFRGVRVNQPLLLEQPRQIWGLPLYVSGTSLDSGEYLMILAPCSSPTALEDYGKRWGIETLFGCLKSRGFRLEDTHLTDPERLGKLVALLALTFCWAFVVGEWLATQRLLKLKQHGRLAKSIFRYGLDHLRRILVNFEHFDVVAWNRVIQLLSCT